MKRRSFLKAGVLGLLGASGPVRAGRSPHVVVVGAGPAGLSAALELVERGVLVTLVESARQVGGKAKGWTEDVDGAAVDVENGLHVLEGPFPHLRDLARRYALDDAFVEVSDPAVGVRFGASLLALGVRESRRVLKDRLLAEGSSWSAVRATRRAWRSLAPEALRRRWSGRSADEVPLSGPAREAMSRARFWVAPADLDAASWVEAERTTGMSFVGGNPQALLWEPLAAAFRSQRGKIRLGTVVQDLVVEGGRVVGVEVGERARSWTVPLPTTGSWEAVEADEPLWIRRSGTSVDAVHGRCTHAGCTVALKVEGFACPCHGGRYDRDGRNIAGPPPEPLPRPRVKVEGASVTLGLGGDLEIVEADAVILAVDARSARRLLRPHVGVGEVGTTHHVVARFWLSGVVPDDVPPVQVVAEGTYVTRAILVHRLQPAARTFAATMGGSVIEVHAGRPLPPAMTNEAALDLLELDLRLVFPSLAVAPIRKRTLARGDAFTLHAPGWRDEALTVDTGLPGVWAAGDHVATPIPGQLLEAAVATGRAAASRVLVGFGAAPIPPASAR